MDIKRLTEAVIVVVVLLILTISVGVMSATEAGHELKTKKILMSAIGALEYTSWKQLANMLACLTK